MRAGRHRQANEVFGQANICKDPARVVVEVQKGARVELEDSWAPLAQLRTSTELLEKRRNAGESTRTSILHRCRLASLYWAARVTAPGDPAEDRSNRNASLPRPICTVARMAGAERSISRMPNPRPARRLHPLELDAQPRHDRRRRDGRAGFCEPSAASGAGQPRVERRPPIRDI